MTSVPPALIFILGAVLLPFLRGRTRSVYSLLLPTLAFLDLLAMSSGSSWIIQFLGYDITFLRVDRLAMVWGYIFVIIAFISNLFALHVDKKGEIMATTLYTGSALGVVFAGDFISLFVFWEIMALAATFIIWYGGREDSINAGFRYILMHIFAGLCLLAGIVITVVQTGSIEFNYMGLNSIGSLFVFLGFIINAAVPPFHRWLPDAYPQASPTGAVYLSAFTTKSSVYVLARAFPGTHVLIYLGAFMTCYPIFYAVLDNDIRGVLSYSLINQVGFMLVGVGIGTPLAINGAAAHAFCHIIYKALLFMSAGSVLHMTGKIRCTDIGGLYKTMPLTAVACMVGAASISAFPLFSGFVSKSMTVTASALGGYVIVWFMLQFASAGVFHHAGIKVPFFTFFGHDSGIRTSDPPRHMLAAMGIASFLCIFIGVYPAPLYSILPYPVDFVPYTAGHVLSQIQLLMFAALAFTLLILSGYYPPEVRAINLDADWFYRKWVRGFLWFINNPLARFGKLTEKIFFDLVPRFVIWFTTLWAALDLKIIDGIINGIAGITIWSGGKLRKVQTGDVQSYATIAIVGVTILLIILMGYA
ncbi:MAG: Na(+)/H(+) antiporter subunit D [Euryarchaeota archaeon]|nr:Na(+)/H(+) antiporter subunit D [Euryarchaeota archaeon]